MGLHPREEIALEVFAANVVDARSKDKCTDFSDAEKHDACLGNELSRDEVFLEKHTDAAQAQAFVTCIYQTSTPPWSTGGERARFTSFGIRLLMLTAYACCAAGNDDQD